VWDYKTGENLKSMTLDSVTDIVSLLLLRDDRLCIACNYEDEDDDEEKDIYAWDSYGKEKVFMVYNLETEECEQCCGQHVFFIEQLSDGRLCCVDEKASINVYG
jgi:hypothetical protein